MADTTSRPSDGATYPLGLMDPEFRRTSWQMIHLRWISNPRRLTSEASALVTLPSGLLFKITGSVLRVLPNGVKSLNWYLQVSASTCSWWISTIHSASLRWIPWAELSFFGWWGGMTLYGKLCWRYMCSVLNTKFTDIKCTGAITCYVWRRLPALWMPVLHTMFVNKKAGEYFETGIGNRSLLLDG